MVAPAGSRVTDRWLIPLPARRYVLRVQVDGTEYCYDATARLASAQAQVIATVREGSPASGGGAALVAMEGALRTAARLAMPLLVRLVGSIRAASPGAAALLPPLVKPPKHTDAMEYLSCWIVEAVFTALGTGVYTLDPDDANAYVDTSRGDLIVLPIARLRWSLEGEGGESRKDAPTTRQEGAEVALAEVMDG